MENPAGFDADTWLTVHVLFYEYATIELCSLNKPFSNSMQPQFQSESECKGFGNISFHSYLKIELITKTKVFDTYTHFTKETVGNLEMVHSDVAFP